MSWNYRIITKLEPHPLEGYEPVRIFYISEVFYESDQVTPRNYMAATAINNFDTMYGLKMALMRSQLAFGKPVLDADNWPNEFPTLEQDQEL